MSTNEDFKYDVRIRERMLAQGALTEKDVQGYLEGLLDKENDIRPVTVSQPALVSSSSASEDEVPESTERP